MLKIAGEVDHRLGRKVGVFSGEGVTPVGPRDSFLQLEKDPANWVTQMFWPVA
jgi:hypothetical protein